MHGVGAALPVDWGGTVLFLSVRLCWFSEDRRVRARRFARSGYQCPGLRVSFPTPDHGRGHIVQHLAECEARAVVLLPDVKVHWFPLVQLATVRAIEVATVGAEGCFQWPSLDGGLKNGGTLAGG